MPQAKLPQPKHIPAKKSKTHTAPDKHDTLYVANAGIILLHPFLQHFFQNMGLLKNGQFISETAQGTAVQWLHFLATGSRECPEPELALAKILCGLPVENPVGRWFEPESAQVEEAESLLVALIRHWPVLKNTSPAGLREGFLRRSGKLETLPDGSKKLRVERQAMDVLLEQLPWGIGIVQLPWMERFLYVEW